MTEEHRIITVFLLDIFMLIVGTFLITRVRNKYSSYVYVIIYAFSVGIVISLLVLGWAYETGAIDKQGQYIGRSEQLIKMIVEFSTDINSELVILESLLVVLIVPQIIAYILSRIFGCSLNPALFRWGSTATM